jgi:uncharacterized membrane protein YtjA (UPF0391 family)
MLRWALIFLLIALVGFGGITVAAAGVAKFLFFLFIVMGLIFLFCACGREKRLIIQDGGRLIWRSKDDRSPLFELGRGLVRFDHLPASS